MVAGQMFGGVYFFLRSTWWKGEGIAGSLYMSLMLHQKREKSEGEYYSDGQANVGK